MKNKIITTIVTLVLLIMITSCGGDVSIIKKGSMNFDRSVDIGDVFKAYSYFNSTKWKAFKDPQGRRIVEITAEVDMKNLLGEASMDTIMNQDISSKLYLTSEYLDKSNYEYSKLKQFLGECNYILGILADRPSYDGWYDTYFSTYINSDKSSGPMYDFPMYKDLVLAIKAHDEAAITKIAMSGLEYLENYVVDIDNSKTIVTFQFTINKDKSFAISSGGFSHSIKLKGFDEKLEYKETYPHVHMLEKIYANKPLT
jgi:hypothetical protein